MADMTDQMYMVEQDPEVLKRINDTFPEGEILESYIRDDRDPNIHLDAAAEVTLTFINEGAGYRNTLGYYTYDLNEDGTANLDSMSDKIVIWENASGIGEGVRGGGVLAPGHTVNLGSFEAGTNIGFYLIADGYWGGNKHYYTISKELSPDGLKHTAAVFDIDSGSVFYGWEDMPNGGDKDYNDLLYTVASTPWTAINRSGFARTDENYFPEVLFSRCACQYNL